MRNARQSLTTYRRSRAVRLASHNYAAETPVHLIICAHQGSPFTEARLARIVCGAVEHVSDQLGFDLYAYCLMPDHLHALVSPADSENDISEFLRRILLTTRYEEDWLRIGRRGRIQR